MTVAPVVAGVAAASAILVALHDRIARTPTSEPPAFQRPGRPRRRRNRPTPDLRRPPDAVSMLLSGAIALVAAVVIGPVVLLMFLGLAGTVAVRAARARRLRHAREVDDTAVDLIDLFGIALASGQPVPSAILTVAGRAPDPIREPLLRASHRLRHGLSVEAVLDELESLGPSHRPLLEILRTTHLHGTPALPALDRIAETARDHRRRSTEARVRRLPVTMLFPLVVCILPAFGILTVVPLLVVSLTDLA